MTVLWLSNEKLGCHFFADRSWCWAFIDICFWSLLQSSRSICHSLFWTKTMGLSYADREELSICKYLWLSISLEHSQNLWNLNIPFQRTECPLFSCRHLVLGNHWRSSTFIVGCEKRRYNLESKTTEVNFSSHKFCSVGVFSSILLLHGTSA